MKIEGKAHPDCINASNPYHECVDYCFQKIAEAKARADAESDSSSMNPPEERTVHPDCINASNPYHECGEHCFRSIAKAKDRAEKDRSGMQQEDGASSTLDASEQSEVPPDDKITGLTEQNDGDGQHVKNFAEASYPIMNERQKKLFELSLKMNEARKANQMAMVAEKKKMEAPPESRGISKQNWIEERKKRIGNLLDSNGLDMSKAYMLDTQQIAEAKYKKWEKEPAPFGWDVAMNSISQETSRSTQSKRVWTELEDEKLIESMLDLHNTGRYTAEGGFKSGFFIEVGKALTIALPNAGIKVDPHIKSRVKTLKTNFAIVWDMLYGPNTSGFGYDDTTKCVVAERPVWDAYIQSHKKAHIFKDRPFPHFKDLCIIFEKDRATGEHAVAPGDLMEDTDREEEVSSQLNNIEGDGLDGIEFSLPEGQEPDIGSPGNNSEAGTSRKRKKKKGGPVDDALVEVIERASTFMGESMKESAIIMSDAITDAKVNEMKQQLSSELAKIEGLSMTDLVRATSKIAGDRNNTLIFYRFTPEQRVEFVKTILE